jgi:hypothetical protein
MSSLAPIALFVYNRLDHTTETVEALKKNILASESDLFIYSDAGETALKQEAVDEVRKYIKNISGFKSVQIIYQEKNKGLSASITSGVTEIVNTYKKIIVLEDDMVTSPHFLKYMNDGLDLYKDEDEVISIHGYMYPVDMILPETFFIKGADCWGWATWKRGWDLFEEDGRKLLDEIKTRKLNAVFDFNNSYPYSKMLEDQIAGKVDSWAIRWYASAFLENKLTLYPGKSLIRNIGIDGSGIHCTPDEKFMVDIQKEFLDLKKISIEHNEEIFKVIAKFFKPEKIKKNKIKLIFKKIFGINKTFDI